MVVIVVVVVDRPRVSIEHKLLVNGCELESVLVCNVDAYPLAQVLNFSDEKHLYKSPFTPMTDTQTH